MLVFWLGVLVLKTTTNKKTYKFLNPLPINTIIMPCFIKPHTLLLSLCIAMLLSPQHSSADEDWAICTLEGLLTLSKNAVNTIEPPFATVQDVSLSFLLLKLSLYLDVGVCSFNVIVCC